MRKLTDFGDKSSDNTQLFQDAIDAVGYDHKERIYVPPGVWIIDEPVVYDNYLSIFGDGYDTEIRGTSNVGSRAMFSRRKCYLEYTGIVGAPHAWVLDGVSTASELGTGVHVEVENLTLNSQSDSNACFEAYNSAIANHWSNVYFKYRFRGLNSVSAFNSVVDSCIFESTTNRLWLQDDLKIENAWGLSIVGHGCVKNCQFNDCVLGMEALSGGTIARQNSFNRCVKGLKLSGLITHPDLLGQQGVVSTSEFSGLSFTDCLRSIDFWFNTSELKNITIQSYNAPQLDGRTTGQPEYGMHCRAALSYGSVSNVLIKGSYSVGATTGVSMGYSPEIAA